MSYIIKYKGRGYLSWGNIFQESTQVLFDRMNHYTDHLGNIRLSYGRDPETNEVAILKESHYYPFGLTHKGYVSEHKIFNPIAGKGKVSLIPVRNYLDDTYRYDFNAKEHQPELGLSWHDYHARNYDAALGRWMNVDPLAEKYPSISSFAYVANNPIYYIDPDGREIIIHYKDDEGKRQQHIYQYGESFEGDKYIENVYDALNYIIDNDADVNGIIKSLSYDTENSVNIFENTKENNRNIDHPLFQSFFLTEGLNTGKAEIIWDSKKGSNFTNTKGFISWVMGKGYSEDGQVSPAEVLLHELGHSFNYFEDPNKHKRDSNSYFAGYGSREEFNVIRNIENPASKALGRKVIRKGHYGSFYQTISPTSIIPKAK